jgi:galactokinase
MEKVVKAFRQHFGTPEYLVRAPGRINFIGGHTDYHEGFVLPAAISRGIWMALRRNNSPNMVHVRALDREGASTFDLGAQPVTAEKWERYVKGLTAIMVEYLPEMAGYDLVFGGDLPIGAGLSSSAALCCGLAAGLNSLFGGSLDAMQLARIAQETEHRFAGVQCGLLDQLAILLSREGHALFLDCRSLEYRFIPLNLKNYSLVLVDSMVRHDHTESGYNTRVKETRAGLERIQQDFPHVIALRDVTKEMLRGLSEELSPKILARCLYVVAENERVQRAAHLLEGGQLEAFGELMFETHLGLRDLYQVSCPELDHIAELSAMFTGCLGARMVGGGFGGNLLAIVKSDAVDHYIGGILQRFSEHFGKKIQAREIELGNGLEVLPYLEQYG